MDPYKKCPVMENVDYVIRPISAEDAADFLKIYSDEKAVPYFNGDNCHGDNFHYTTMERMRQAVDFWIMSYENGWFVRWSIVDKKTNRVIGTIEFFKRSSDNSFDGCGVLRLDLASEFEKADVIKNTVSLFLTDVFEPFGVDTVITKVWSYAEERKIAFSALGFSYTEEKLIGNDGTEYGDYYVLNK